MGKASEIVSALTPSMGAAAARDAAMAAVEKNLAENDLTAAPAFDTDVITEVIKSLASASTPAAKPGTTTVQVQHSAPAAAGAEVDIDVTLAQLQGTCDGLAAKLDHQEVYLNKSFGALSKILDMFLRGMSAVDKHVLDQGSNVVELAKSLNTRQAPKSVTGRVEAAPNLQDQATSQEVVAGGRELANRVHLQQMIAVEIQKSATLEQTAPGSQKARMKQLSEASLMLTRPIASEAIALHANSPLPA